MSMIGLADLPSVPVTTESDVITLSDLDETLVASDVGTNSCCDVWMRVPAAWMGRVRIRLYARLGDARLLLRQVAVERVPITSSSDGMISGIAISVRGHPASAFEVTCQATEGPDAIDNGYVYLQSWYANVPPYVSGGDILPETKVSPPMVAAVLVGRDEASGDLVQISTDSSGRFIMSNPLFTEADRELLDGATDAATPSTLVKRDASGDDHFRHLYVRGVDFETTGGVLAIGTETSTTGITIGSSGSTTTLWNATLEGSTTVIDSTSLQVTDRVITVNRTAGPNAPVPSQIAGISVMRGDISGANRNFVGLFWDESASVFRLAFNTSGDDSTLGVGVPVVAAEYRGPASAPAVLKANALTDSIQLIAAATTLLAASDASGTSKLDSGDRPLLLGALSATGGAGHTVTIQAQQGHTSSVGGNLNLQAGKGGTPGTDSAGDVVIENGQVIAAGTSGFTRWQSNGSDYLKLQQTSAGPTFTTADGCQLILKASGGGTTLNANTGNLNLYGNGLGTLYAAALTLGGSTFTLEDASLNHTVSVSNVRSNWSWTFDAAVTNPTIQQANNATNSASATGLNILAQGATGTASTGGLVQVAGGPGTSKGGGALLAGGEGSGTGSGGDAAILGGDLGGSPGKDGNVSIHQVSPNFQGGGRIAFIGDATAEPTGNPASGTFLFGRTGQLVTRDKNGFVNEISTRFIKTASVTSVRRLERADSITKTGTTPATALHIPSTDFPSGSATGHATVRVLGFDTTKLVVCSFYRSVTVMKLSSVVSVVNVSTAGATVGADVDHTGAAVVVTFDTSSSDFSVQVNNSGSDTIRFFAHVDLILFEH